MAAVAPVPIAPVDLPSWRPGRSSPSGASGASAPCPSPAAAVAAVAAPLAAAVTTASRRPRRLRLGRRVEGRQGRPVSVVVEETDRHDLEGAAWAIRDLGVWGLEKAYLKMGWPILM